MANIKGLKAILKKCFEMKLPEAYVDDFCEHDFNSLMEKDAPETFLWVLRECGTFLYDLKRKQYEWIDAVVHTWGTREKCYWFLFKDDKLIQFRNAKEWKKYYFANTIYETVKEGV